MNYLLYRGFMVGHRLIELELKGIWHLKLSLRLNIRLLVYILFIYIYIYIAVDIWGAGVMMMSLLSGKHPLCAPHNKIPLHKTDTSYSLHGLIPLINIFGIKKMQEIAYHFGIFVCSILYFIVVCSVV